jgi:hypothetical protein
MMRALAVTSLAGLVSAGLGPGSLAASDTCGVTEPIRAEPPRDPNADPFGTGPWYVNADRSIWAGWDAVRMVAGEKGNKVLWIRPQGTQLVVSGRRLDVQASPLKARIPCCYPTGFQASGLMFPSGGCWEISAKAGASTLSFVTRVGPDPRGH